jgi:hypothetical protein
MQSTLVMICGSGIMGIEMVLVNSHLPGFICGPSAQAAVMVSIRSKIVAAVFVMVAILW